MIDYSDPLIYGKSQTSRIVGCHPVWGGSRAEMKYYIREVDDTIFSETVEWFPFAFLHDEQCLAGIDDETIKIVQLNGGGYFNKLVYTDNYSSFKKVKSRIRLAEDESRQYGGDPVGLLPGHYSTAWLIQSGNTMFKGMQFDDVVRMQIDIETYGKEHFALARNPEDCITIIVISNNRGEERCIHHHPEFKHYGEYVRDERELINRLSSYIQEWNPDVLELHNGFKYDLPYIIERAEYHGIELKWGRDGSKPWGFRRDFRAAENTLSYTTCQIAGRHVVDTMFAAMSWDVIFRELESYSLKNVAQHFGFVPEDRTYVDGDRIWWHWDNDPKPLLDYALDDVYETRSIAEELLGASFYTTQILPMTYEDVCRSGTGGKISALFFREYLRQRHSIPKPKPQRSFQGAKTRILVRGVVGPIVHADVESLYPSIMLNFDGTIPKSDELEIFRKLLSRLTDLRFVWKNEMKKHKKGSVEYRKWAGQQNSAKILINSHYGVEGDAHFPFNDFEAAETVTAIGRDILTRMVDYVEGKGGTVVEIDTDGIYFVPPEGIVGEEAERAFVDEITGVMPPGIKIGFDGRYEKMLSYKAKNYILQEYNGKRNVKGSSFRSRKMEGFGKEFIKKGFDAILDGGIESLRELYLHYRGKIIRHEIPIEDLMSRSSLTKSLEDYKRDLSKPRVNRQAPYEVALYLRDRYKEPIGKGDKVSYYISGNGSDQKGFELAKPIREYEVGDANISHYLARLDKLTEKFEPLFVPKDFQDLFRPEETPTLFPPDYSTIKTVSAVKVNETETETDD